MGYKPVQREHIVLGEHVDLGSRLLERSRLALAFDNNDLDDVVRLARLMRDYFQVAKVGLELYSASGPMAVDTLANMGYEIFCDLKFHDIPTTVYKAAKVIGSLGVTYVTMHASGGREMLQAGVEGITEGFANASSKTSAQMLAKARTLAAGNKTFRENKPFSGPVVVAVTVLTHQRTANEDLQSHQIQMALDSGCGGIVCAASDLALVSKVENGQSANEQLIKNQSASEKKQVHSEQVGRRLLRVVPGIRMPGDSVNDQRRVATPAAALAAGADLLVIGRAVTNSSDPVKAAQRIHDSNALMKS